MDLALVVCTRLFANDADGALWIRTHKIVNSFAETEAGRVALKSSLGTHAQHSGHHRRCHSNSKASLFDFPCCVTHESHGHVFCAIDLIRGDCGDQGNEQEDVRWLCFVCRGSQDEGRRCISSDRVGDMEGAPSETRATITEYLQR